MSEIHYSGRRPKPPPSRGHIGPRRLASERPEPYERQRVRFAPCRTVTGTVTEQERGADLAEMILELLEGETQ